MTPLERYMRMNGMQQQPAQQQVAQPPQQIPPTQHQLIDDDERPERPAPIAGGY